MSLDSGGALFLLNVMPCALVSMLPDSDVKKCFQPVLILFVAHCGTSHVLRDTCTHPVCCHPPIFLGFAFGVLCGSSATPAGDSLSYGGASLDCFLPDTRLARFLPPSVDLSCMRVLRGSSPGVDVFCQRGLGNLLGLHGPANGHRASVFGGKGGV